MELPDWIKLLLEVLKYAFPTGLGGVSLILHSRASKKGCKPCRDREILKNQMKRVEVYQSDIVFKMIEDFREMTEDEKDIKHYEELVYNAERMTRSYIRVRLQENHIAEKTPESFKIWEDEIITHIEERITKFYNNRFQKFSMTRDEIKEYNTEKLVPYIEKKYRELLLECRDITKGERK